MESTSEIFNDSWDRVQQNSHEFIESFHKNLFNNSEEIKNIFIKAKIKNPQSLLRSSILYLIAFSSSRLPVKTLLRLSNIHNLLNITHQQYDLWMLSLLQAVETSDPKYTPAVRQAWQNTLERGLNYLKGNEL